MHVLNVQSSSWNAGSHVLGQAGLCPGAGLAERSGADTKLSTEMQASPFFDKLVFNKVKARLGGQVRLIVTGGAPLANHVEEFLKVCFCCPVVQGFGLTETCAASCIAVPDLPVRASSFLLLLLS